MLITHGLALFDPENNMEVVKWYFDLHSHPGNSYRANMADLKIGMQNSMHSFIVSEKGILLYGGEVDVTLDDLARIGIELYEEDRKLLSQNVHIANSIDKYVSQITELAGRNYYKLDLFGGEDAEMVSDYLGIPFRLYKWGSEEIKDVLAYINGDDKALPYFNRRSFEEKFFLPKLPNA